MAKFDDGQDGVTSFDEILYNNFARAFKNAITDSGQAIDATNTQMSKALANYAHVSNYYTENGAVNAYNLVSINNFKGLTALTIGSEVRFRATNANTTASTVNVNGLGAVSIKQADGTTDPAAGDISTTQDTRLRYDGTVWRLQTLITQAASLGEVIAATLVNKYVSPNTLGGLYDNSTLAVSGSEIIPLKVGGVFVKGIKKWGTDTATLAGATITFPQAFPNASLAILATPRSAPINVNSHAVYIPANTAANFTLQHNRTDTSCFWQAIGY